MTVRRAKESARERQQLRASVARGEVLLRVQQEASETQASRIHELLAEMRAAQHQLADLVRRVDELAPYVVEVAWLQRQVLQLRNGSNAKKKRRPKR
jgi:hypothetical protein